MPSQAPAKYDYRRPENAERLGPNVATSAPARVSSSPKKSAPAKKPATQVRPPRPSGRKIQAESVTGTNYQVPVLAEFVVAILLASLTPLATKQNQDGLSPYVGKDILKISSLTVLYLILAIMTLFGRGPGRYAAWFGGLILLVVGLNEAANIAKDLNILTPASPSGAATADTSGVGTPANQIPGTGASGASTGKK